MKLDGKVVLITGAARGLGRGYAEGVLDRGAKVSNSLLLTAKNHI